MLNRNVIYSNEKNIMPINVFKKHPGNPVVVDILSWPSECQVASQ